MCSVGWLLQPSVSAPVLEGVSAVVPQDAEMLSAFAAAVTPLLVHTDAGWPPSIEQMAADW